MPAWKDFLERVRELRSQNCGLNEMIRRLMQEYPSIASSADEALRKIQKADRDNRNLDDW